MDPAKPQRKEDWEEKHLVKIWKKTRLPSYLKADHSRMRACSYGWTLPVRRQRWRSYQSICHFRKPLATATRKPLGSICYSYSRSRIKIFDHFCSCDHDLDPMTFIYELNPYSLEIYRIWKYELPTSRLSTVIVWQTDRQTWAKLYITSLRGWSKQREIDRCYQVGMKEDDSRSNRQSCMKTSSLVCGLCSKA